MTDTSVSLTNVCKNANFLVALLAFFVLFFAKPAWSNDGSDAYAIFTLNKNFNDLSTSKARLLYRGRMKTIKGQRIELCDWSSQHKVRTEFYQMLLGKDRAQMNAHWASLSFSGKARPPKQLSQDSMTALVDWLSEKENRIGYAPLNSIPQEANILYVVRGESNL